MSWRSVMFTPGTRPERVQKAWEQGLADVVVADLEDGVAPSQKDAARSAVARLLAGTDDAACRRAVRINAWPGDLAEADLDAVMAAPPSLIVVPKAEDPDALQALAMRLPRGTGIMAILETAQGVLDAPRLAAVPGVEALALGAEDLAADAGMVRSMDNAEVSLARGWVALAAAAARVAAIDMVTADLADEQRLRREVREAVGLGYAGKMCLHPAQVSAVHGEMAPTPEQLRWARSVQEAARAADAEQGGVVVVEGRMVDVPVIRQARAILARAGSEP